MSNKLLKAYPGKPAKFNIETIQGDTFSMKFTGYAKDGSPYDFTGHTFRMQVKTHRGEDVEPLIDIPNDDFELTMDTRGLALDRHNQFIIEHDKENMEILQGDYVFDIEMTDAGDRTQTIAQEREYFRVNLDVSE